MILEIDSSPYLSIVPPGFPLLWLKSWQWFQSCPRFSDTVQSYTFFVMKLKPAQGVDPPGCSGDGHPSVHGPARGWGRSQRWGRAWKHHEVLTRLRSSPALCSTRCPLSGGPLVWPLFGASQIKRAKSSCSERTGTKPERCTAPACRDQRSCNHQPLKKKTQPHLCGSSVAPTTMAWVLLLQELCTGTSRLPFAPRALRVMITSATSAPRR